MEDQAAVAEFIEVKSPIDRFKEQWAQQPGKIPFLRQRDFMLQHPGLVQYAELASAKGWIQPLFFAVQGLVLAGFLISAFSWLITRDRGWYTDQIAATRAEMQSEIKTEQAVIDAAQVNLTKVEKSRNNAGFTVADSSHLSREEAIIRLNAIIEEARQTQQQSEHNGRVQMQNLRAAGDASALAASGTPIVFSLALLFAAPVFRRFLQKSFARYRLTALAENYYMYYTVSHGIWFNCGLVLALNLLLSRSAYGLSGMLESIGPIGRILVWLALYALLLYWFFLASKDLYKAMQLPRPGEILGPDNKVLLHLHNSFWIVFAIFEAALGLLAFLVYLLEKA